MASAIAQLAAQDHQFIRMRCRSRETKNWFCNAARQGTGLRHCSTVAGGAVRVLDSGMSGMSVVENSRHRAAMSI